MNFSAELSHFFSVLRHQPMERKLYSIIGESQVDDSGFAPTAIRPNEDYFTLRLCEMYLTDIREYFRRFVPMALLVSDFKYAGTQHTVPFLLDNKMLGLESYLQGAYVEFKNTRVAGPFPYVGDDVALFTGLFRLEASNLAKSLFTLFENLLNAFDPCGLSQYLTIAKTLGQNLPSILNMKECEFRLGARDVFTEKKEAPNQFRQNYIAYVNCPEKTYRPGELRVKNNRLYSDSDISHAVPVTDYDYCLMKIERTDTRHDYTSFGFYSLWKEAYKSLLANEVEKAKIKKSEFLQQIYSCPDLTETHKEELILLFEIKYTNFKDQLAGGKNRGKATRGAGTASGNLVTKSLQSSAVMANKLNLPKKVGRDLNHLKEAWRDIPHLKAAETESKEIEKGQDAVEKTHLINQQLAALRKIRKKGRPDPSSLVEALVFSTFKQ